jgi:hypothetical protein
MSLTYGNYSFRSVCLGWTHSPCEVQEESLIEPDRTLEDA